MSVLCPILIYINKLSIYIKFRVHFWYKTIKRSFLGVTPWFNYWIVSNLPKILINSENVRIEPYRRSINRLLLIDRNDKGNLSISAGIWSYPRKPHTEPPSCTRPQLCMLVSPGLCILNCVSFKSKNFVLAWKQVLDSSIKIYIIHQFIAKLGLSKKVIFLFL